MRTLNKEQKRQQKILDNAKKRFHAYLLENKIWEKAKSGETYVQLKWLQQDIIVSNHLNDIYDPSLGTPEVMTMESGEKYILLSLIQSHELILKRLNEIHAPKMHEIYLEEELEN